MLSWLIQKIKGPSARHAETAEERAIPGQIAGAIMSLERKTSELRRELNAREETYRRVVKNREGQRP